MRFPWNRMETDLSRELEHHLHQLTAEFERLGHSHREAMLLAKREFGGSDQVKERCRDERRWAWMTGIRQDVVGIVLGVAASRLLSAIVYQASAQDPFVLGSVVLTMMLTGSPSVAGPVRRALRIDPAKLLREQ